MANHPEPQVIANREDPVPLLNADLKHALTQSSDAAVTSNGKHDQQATKDHSHDKKSTGTGRVSMQDRLLSKMRKRDKIKATSAKLMTAARAARDQRTKRKARLLEQVIPPQDANSIVGEERPKGGQVASRPGFSLPVMTSNFRRFNARIGVIFVFQNNLLSLLTWTHPTQTLSLACIFTFLVLHPILIPLVPPLATLFYILIPAYLSRHPPPPHPVVTVSYSTSGTATSSSATSMHSLSGPALAPPKTIAPASDFSSDFFRNMRDLQNVMGDFSSAHDAVLALVSPAANFADEAASSALFLSLVFVSGALAVLNPWLPWHVLVLGTGYVLLALGHPRVQAWLAAHYETKIRPRAQGVRRRVAEFVARDIVLDAAPEVREVEVFELQRRRRGAGGYASSSAAVIEYEPWVFSPSAWEPRAPARVSGDRVRGARFFEDVASPEGWEWLGKKWVLDLDSKEWVESRMLGDVEVETEGERWVYDVEQADGRNKRGEWRRRRWVRMVRRKVHRGENTPANATRRKAQ